MITVQNISYNETVDLTSFTYIFDQSGYRQSSDETYTGQLTEAQIIERLQPEYEAWIERNQIP